jgi:hypothetical protein
LQQEAKQLAQEIGSSERWRESNHAARPCFYAKKDAEPSWHEA